MEKQTRPGALTQRQTEIIELAAQGLSDQEIAQRLKLSHHTVLTHWKNIRETFNSKNRAAIIASVVVQKQKTSSDSLEEVNQLLLFEAAQNNYLVRQLEEANQKLREALDENQRLLASHMSSGVKLSTQLKSEIEGYQTLDKHMTSLVLVVHAGEYGASWLKKYMSESVRYFGHTPAQWLSGEVTIYDLQRPQDTQKALKNLQNFDGKRERSIITYIFKDAEGKLHQMIDFLSLTPYDQNGVGTYHGFTFDITPWVKDLKALVDSGELEEVYNELNLDPS